MSAFLSVAFVVSVLRIAVPYALAATGGMWSERGGVVNIALEGMMLAGAFGFVLGCHLAGGWTGVAAGLLAGELVAGLLVLSVVGLGADAIVTGVALNLLVAGLTRYGLKLVWGSSSNSSRVDGFTGGEGLLGLITHPLFVLTVVGIAASPLLLGRTRFGLRLRACGEHPAAVASLGVSVAAHRAAGTLLGGLFAGLAGVWLAADQHQFTDNMSAGRGYVALAAMITGGWRPAWGAAVALLFGLAEAVQITLQGQGTGIPTQLLQMMPYVLTLLALVGFVGRTRPPAALGRA
jgi:simple sugar transport system permease protein